RGSKSIKVIGRFQRRQGPLSKRNDIVATLHWVASVLHLRDRDIGPRNDHFEAALICPYGTHFVKNGSLPFGPVDFDCVNDRPNYQKLVAHLCTLLSTLV